jgi:hypothetical protein
MRNLAYPNGITRVILGLVAPQVATEDLIDAQGIADLLSLSHRNTVSVYQKRYAGMPRPIIDLGRGRCRLWSRPAIVEWARKTGRLPASA